MTWHPSSRIGVIALTNGRYAAPVACDKALGFLVVESPKRLHNEAPPAVEGIRRVINSALTAGDFASIEPLLAANVDLDKDLRHRAAQVTGLAKMHGALTPEVDLTVIVPTQVGWWLKGERGRVKVEIM